MGPYPVLANGMSVPHSIFEVKTSPVVAVGTRATLSDGRTFFYGVNRSGTAHAAATLLVKNDVIANHEDQVQTASGATVTAGLTKVLIAVGATLVSADQYSEGYAAVTDVTGEGYLYKIRNHTTTAGSTDITAYLYDPIAVAWGATSTVTLLANHYADMVISATDQNNPLVGVPTFGLPIGSTTPQYGWIQTWGYCTLLADETWSAFGQAITIGTGTAGAFEEDDTATTVSQEQLVGYNIGTVTDTEHSVVTLTIAP